MSAMLTIVPIVEGQGEVEAVPILLRRMSNAIDPEVVLDVRKPIRVGRDKIVKEGELERYVELAARTAGPAGAVLLLLDADDACPAELAPRLLERTRSERPDLRSAVVLANREYEAWFLAGAGSLASRRGLPNDLTAPDDAESIRDAKGWLQARRTDGFAYSPTADQPALTAHLDLEAARGGSPSFDKLFRDLESLVRSAV